MKRYIHTLTGLAAAVLVLLMAACSTDDGAVTEASGTGVAAVAFTATVPAFQTRSIINATTDLQDVGFGVFAYHTGSSPWASAGASSAPNFMYNQLVTYAATSWQYSPVKYWPNDNTPADDSGATGSQEHSYVSFFAYAPYNGSGLTPSANTATGAPTIGYTWATTTDPNAQTDLLYASQTDCYKTMAAGYGTVSGRVPFLFRHALTAIEFKVRRKELSGDQIFLQSLSLNTIADATAAATPQASLNVSGTFNLGTPGWSSFATTPTLTLTYSGTIINTALTSTGTGVTAITSETAHALTSYTPNLLLLMPQESTVTIPFTLSYTLGGTQKSPSSTITFTKPTEGWALEMGKKYTVVFIIDGGEVESYLLRAKEAEQW